MIVINFVVATMIGLLSIGNVFGQECRIIKIHGRAEQGSIALEPEKAFLSKGDCVVWFNLFVAPKVNVTFEDGNRCIQETKGDKGEWNLNEQNCYVASWIPFGGVLNLRFMEKGTYKYRIKAKDFPDVKAEGQIIVE